MVKLPSGRPKDIAILLLISYTFGFPQYLSLLLQQNLGTTELVFFHRLGPFIINLLIYQPSGAAILWDKPLQAAARDGNLMARNLAVKRGR